MHFTAKMIDGLEAGPERFEMREAGGLTIRVTPTGRKVWSLVWRRGGKLTRATLGEFPGLSLPEARAAGSRLRAESGDETRSTEPTWQELVETWIDEQRAAGAPPRPADLSLLRRRALPVWGHQRVSAVRQGDIRRLVAEVAAEAPVAAHRLLRVVRRVCHHAKDARLIATNPAARIAAPTLERTRRRLLSQSEIGRFWNALSRVPCRPGTRLALKLVLVTGLRVGQVCALRWEDIDLERHECRPGPASKGRTTVHLSPLAMKILCAARMSAPRSEWVFSSANPDRHLQPNTLGNALRRHRDALPLAPFSPDDLRRTAGAGEADPLRWAERILQAVRVAADA